MRGKRALNLLGDALMQTRDVVMCSMMYILGQVAQVSRSATYLFTQSITSNVIGVVVCFFFLGALRTIKKDEIILHHDGGGLKRIAAAE